MATPESLASDPLADPAALAELAHQHPELQRQIAENPAAYPGLLEWISSYGTQDGKDAATARLHGRTEPSLGQGTAEDPTDFASLFATDPIPITANDETVIRQSDRTVIRQAREAETAVQPVFSPPAAPPVAPPPAAFGGPAPTSPPIAGQLPTQPGFSFTSPPPAPPGQNRTAPSAAPKLNQPRQDQKNSAGVIIAIGLAAILVVVVAFGAWFLFFRGDSTDTSEQDAAEARAAQLEAELEEEKAARKQLEADQAEQERLESETTAPEEEYEEATSSVTSFPPPATAVSAPWFVSETRNTACEIDASGVTCTIYEVNFGLSAQGCTSTPYTITIPEQGQARWDCSLPIVPNDSNGPVLEYSTSSSVGNGACLATFRGMSCWNTKTGSSFAIARDGFTMGTTGLIPETAFPWR